MAKNKKTILIMGIIIMLVMLGAKKMSSNLDTPIGIKFEKRSNLAQAIVDGQDYPNAEGRFGVSITNQKTITIYNVSFNTKWDDASGGGPFESAAFPWSTIDLSASQTSSSVLTDWFDLEWYAENNPGDNIFYFRFNYDYIDAEGIADQGNQIDGSITVNILPSDTQDYVDFRTGLITYDYVSSCGGGSSDGTRWIAYTDHCSEDLIGYGYVSSSSSTLRSCEQEAADEGWVFIMNVPYSPSGTCEIASDGDGVAKLYNISADRGQGYLAICENDVSAGFKYRYYRDTDSDASDAVTTPTPVTPTHENICSGQKRMSCGCDAWEDQGCGLDECTSSEMFQIRTCEPKDCMEESQCIEDLSCIEPLQQTESMELNITEQEE